MVKIVRTTGVSFIVQRDQLLLISTIHETQKSLRATTARGLIGDISAANASSPPTAPFLPHSSNSAYQNIRAKFSTKKTQKYTGNALERNDQSGYLAVQPAKKGDFPYKTFFSSQPVGLKQLHFCTKKFLSSKILEITSYRKFVIDISKKNNTKNKKFRFSVPVLILSKREVSF